MGAVESCEVNCERNRISQNQVFRLRDENGQDLLTCCNAVQTDKDRILAQRTLTPRGFGSNATRKDFNAKALTGRYDESSARVNEHRKMYDGLPFTSCQNQNKERPRAITHTSDTLESQSSPIVCHREQLCCRSDTSKFDSPFQDLSNCPIPDSTFKSAAHNSSTKSVAPYCLSLSNPASIDCNCSKSQAHSQAVAAIKAASVPPLPAPRRRPAAPAAAAAAAPSPSPESLATEAAMAAAAADPVIMQPLRHVIQRFPAML